MEEKKTMWGMPPKGMKRIKWIDAAEKDSFDRGEKEKRKIIERYGRPHVRFSEEQVKGMAVEEFELDKRIIREKKKKKIQTGFW